MSALELYQQTVKSMSAAERLRLASLILNDLQAIVDESDEWSEQDMIDATRASLANFEQSTGGDDGAGW